MKKSFIPKMRKSLMPKPEKIMKRALYEMTWGAPHRDYKKQMKKYKS